MAAHLVELMSRVILLTNTNYFMFVRTGSKGRELVGGGGIGGKWGGGQMNIN